MKSKLPTLALASFFFAVASCGIAFLWWITHRERPQVPVMAKIEHLETKGIPQISGPRMLADGSVVEWKLTKTKQVLLVNFWASWCSPCVEEIPALVELQKKLSGKLMVIAISGDNEQNDIWHFLTGIGSGIANDLVFIWDSNKGWMNDFGVEKLPESFVFGVDGKLKKKIVGKVDWAGVDSIDYFSKLALEQ
jgi:thiol-disulfide isomerase/thioredoxin